MRVRARAVTVMTCRCRVTARTVAIPRARSVVSWTSGRPIGVGLERREPATMGPLCRENQPVPVHPYRGKKRLVMDLSGLGGAATRDLTDIPEPDDALLHTLDAQAEFRPESTPRPVLHAMVVIVSDAPEDTQRSGELVAELLVEEDFMVDAVLQVESRKPAIRKAIQTAVVGGADLVITVGGTGFGPRDKAPEATRAELDRKVPGIAEALRASGLSANALDAGLSRGIAGISGSTVVVNIASSRGAIRDGMATLGPLVRHVIGGMNGTVS